MVEYLSEASVALPKRVRTSARGIFATRVRITGTTSFLVTVPDATVACHDPSAAPRGCVSLTVAGTNTRDVRVVVPTRR